MYSNSSTVLKFCYKYVSRPILKLTVSSKDNYILQPKLLLKYAACSLFSGQLQKFQSELELELWQDLICCSYHPYREGKPDIWLVGSCGGTVYQYLHFPFRDYSFLTNYCAFSLLSQMIAPMDAFISLPTLSPLILKQTLF